MLKRSGKNDVLQANLDMLSISTEDIRRKMLEEGLAIIKLIGDSQIDAACAKLLDVAEYGDLLEKQIKMFITQKIEPALESGGRFSYSLEEINKKKVSVNEWIRETSTKSKQLQNLLHKGGMQPEQFTELMTMIARDPRFSDLVNALRVTVMESEMKNVRFVKDVYTAIFRSLNLHPIVRKSSEKLFGEGDYEHAISEGCKRLINYVKEKSGHKTLDGQRLMCEVFGVKYQRDNLRITKRPILQLNNLGRLEEIDEQEGFMHLYQGLVAGVRNPEAHATVEQKDPYRALEYLSLISLLARRVDEAKVNNTVKQSAP